MPSFDRPLDEAIFARGLFLHWYSGAEHAINTLLIRAGGDPAYREMAVPLPYGWERRLKLLSRIMDAPGPIARYTNALRPAVEEMTVFERYRHIMAHMLMVVRDTEHGTRRVVFDGHDWIDGGLGSVGWDVTLEELRFAAADMERVSTTVGRIIYEIIKTVPLLPIEQEPLRALAVEGRKL